MGNRKKIMASSVWYVFSNFLISGIHFLITPFFSRILSNEEYGLYSNYVSWISNFQILTSLMLLVSLYTASLDFKDDLDNYIGSMLCLSVFFTSCLLGLTYIFKNQFEQITGISSKYILIMYLFLVSNPITNFFQLRQRLDYQYKKSVIVSLLIAISTVGGALIGVLISEDKLSARIFGSQIPNVIINFSIVFALFKKRPKIKRKYWRYALNISIPYMFHSIGTTILSSFDRIMITKICGAYDNSLYSIAYMCAQIVTLFTSSIAASIDPWLLKQVNTKDTKAKVITTYLAGGMLIICIGIILLAPEFLLIIGGQKYKTAMVVMPPVIIGLYFQFIYSLYASVEQFNKKTFWMAIATAFVAACNIVLNALFLPIYGYSAASYTTLACYILLYIIHYIIIWKMGLSILFNNKILILLGLLGILFSVLMCIIYQIQIIRWIFVLSYIVILFTMLLIYRKKIKSFIISIWRES